MFKEAIDKETYQRCRRECVELLEEAKMARVELETNQLDLDGVLRFARHLLRQPQRWWAEAGVAERN